MLLLTCVLTEALILNLVYSLPFEAPVSYLCPVMYWCAFPEPPSENKLGRAIEDALETKVPFTQQQQS